MIGGKRAWTLLPARKRGWAMLPARRRAWALLLLPALAAAYPLLGYASWLVPANPGWRPAPGGTRLFVLSNGVHSGIAMPAVSPAHDWPRRLGLRVPAGAWLWIGWGQRDFYLGTPRWQDVRPGPVLAALLGSERVLAHVDLIAPPVAGDGARAIDVTPEQARRLAAAIDASIVPGARPIPGYGARDRFFAARGRYSALSTCNNWTGGVLREAGIRVGRWTPTAGSVLAGY